MTLADIRAQLEAGREGMWWSFRLLQYVLQHFHETSEDQRVSAVNCFIRIAAEDHAWATAQLAGGGPDVYRFSKLLSEQRLDSALEHIQLATVKDEALLKARILVAVARWSETGADRERVSERAWDELLRVPESERDSEWKTTALSATGLGHYGEYRQLANERLASVADNFDRSSLLSNAIATAARHKDWQTFEAWASDFRRLPRSLQSPHAACALINFEGIRALDEGRQSDAEESMRQLLAVAPSGTFLANAEVSGFPERLRTEGLCLDLCDQFDALVESRDWRQQGVAGSRVEGPTS